MCAGGGSGGCAEMRRTNTQVHFYGIRGGAKPGRNCWEGKGWRGSERTISGVVGGGPGGRAGHAVHRGCGAAGVGAAGREHCRGPPPGGGVEGRAPGGDPTSGDEKGVSWRKVVGLDSPPLFPLGVFADFTKALLRVRDSEGKRHGWSNSGQGGLNEAGETCVGTVCSDRASWSAKVKPGPCVWFTDYVLMDLRPGMGWRRLRSRRPARTGRPRRREGLWRACTAPAAPGGMESGKGKSRRANWQHPIATFGLQHTLRERGCVEKKTSYKKIEMGEKIVHQRCISTPIFDKPLVSLSTHFNYA